jgi:hypothetical protein
MISFFTSNLQEDSIDVEMLLLNNDVDYLKKKLAAVCTFDYHAVILPLFRAYIWVSMVIM